MSKRWMKGARLAVALMAFGGAVYGAGAGTIDPRCPKAFTYDQLREMSNGRIISEGSGKFHSLDPQELEKTLPKDLPFRANGDLHNRTRQVPTPKKANGLSDFYCSYAFKKITGGITHNEYHYQVIGTAPVHRDPKGVIHDRGALESVKENYDPSQHEHHHPMERYDTVPLD